MGLSFLSNRADRPSPPVNTNGFFYGLDRLKYWAMMGFFNVLCFVFNHSALLSKPIKCTFNY